MFCFYVYTTCVIKCRNFQWSYWAVKKLKFIKLHVIELTFSLNKTWGQTFLTHDTPEGSIIKSSGPSGPWELNRTLWEKERCRSFTVQQHTKQNADCSIETFLNVSKKIPAVFFRILDFIYNTTIGFDKQK